MKNMINYIKNNRNKSIIIAVFVLAFLVWLVWSNISIEISRYIVCDELIPSTFDGFKIAQVSDLHNAEFGENNETLIEKIEKENPDIIVITGDTLDYFHTNVDVAVTFIEQAIKIAPCYYVTGNHEGWDDVGIGFCNPCADICTVIFPERACDDVNDTNNYDCPLREYREVQLRAADDEEQD